MYLYIGLIFFFFFLVHNLCMTSCMIFFSKILYLFFFFLRFDKNFDICEDDQIVYLFHSGKFTFV